MNILLTHGADTFQGGHGDPPLQKQLEASGCRVVHVPLITTRQVLGARASCPLIKSGKYKRAGCPRSKGTDWIAFASRNGVMYFPDIDVPKHVKLAAVGEATAHAVRKRFGRCDLVSPEGNVASLGKALGAQPHITHVLLSCAREGREMLIQDVCVTRMVVYETVLLDPGPWNECWQPDVVVFASPSAVRAWCAWKLRPEVQRVVSLGNATSEALRDAGIHVTAQAQRPDVKSLYCVILANAGTQKEIKK